MLPSDCLYPIQKHLRDFLRKANNCDDLEEDLNAELYRREADGDKPGGLNQLERFEEKNEDEKEKGKEWPERAWLDVWSPEYG